MQAIKLDELSQETIDEQRTKELNESLLSCFAKTDSEQVVLVALATLVAMILSAVPDPMKRRRLIRGIVKIISV